MSTLFELVDDMEQLHDMATDPDCDPQVLDDTLEGIIGAIEVKAGGYVNVIKQLEMEQKQAEELSKAFAAKAKIRENSIKRMKNALLIAMERMDKKELPAGDFTFKIQKNGGLEPLVIDAPENVPDSMTKIIIEPDKDKIRQFLKDNTADWAHIEPRGKHIVIK